MPRYKYHCAMCDYTKTYFHGINDIIEVCENCDESTMKKVLGKFNLKNKKKTLPEQVGSLTKEYIEANREILEEQRKQAKEEKYESS